MLKFCASARVKIAGVHEMHRQTVHLQKADFIGLNFSL